MISPLKGTSLLFLAIATAIVVVMVAVGAVSMGPSHSGLAGGRLIANFDIGPTQPVCYASETVGPAGGPWSSVDVVISSGSKAALTIPVSWWSTSCSVYGTATTGLAAGDYSISLTDCCGFREGLPQNFSIYPGQTTTIDVNVDTGIR